MKAKLAPIPHQPTTSTTLSANLVNWPDNPRKHRPQEAVVEMMESIIENGQLVALHVRRAPHSTGETYEVIFGETKRQAIALGIKQRRLPADYPVRIEINDISDEEAQVRAIAENVQRNTMTDVDMSASVHKLAQTMKSAEVKKRLGLSHRQYDRYLTFARLDDRAQKLIIDNVRPYDWGVAVAQCEGALRNRIIDDVLSNPNMWAQVDQIQAERRKKQILASNALFDLSKAGLATVIDLFDGDEWISDIEGFWKHQNAEIDKLRDKLEAEGHDTVTILDTEPPLYQYVPADENSANKRLAIIYKKLDGEVKTYTNLTTPVASKKGEEESDLGDIFSDDGEDLDHQVLAASGASDPSISGEVPAENNLAQLVQAYPSPSTTLPSKKVVPFLMRALDKARVSMMADDDQATAIFFASLVAGEIDFKSGLTAEQKLDLEDIFQEAGLDDNPSMSQFVSAGDKLATIGLPRLARAAVPLTTDKAPFAPNSQKSVLQTKLAENRQLQQTVFLVDDQYLEALSIPELRGLAVEMKVRDIFEFDPSRMSSSQLRSTIISRFTEAYEDLDSLDPAAKSWLRSWMPAGI